MLSLMLLRHAKAEPAGSGDDHGRALTREGEADAGRLGRYLERVGHQPDRALVSSALRAKRTYEIVAARTAAAASVERSLYNATPTQIRDAAAATEAGTQRLMVVGHNPGIMELASDLAGEGDLPDLERLRSRFPPCGLAVIAFRGDTWEEVVPGAGRLEWFVTPEDLRRGD